MILDQIKILIVDDHAVVREGIKRVLAKDPLMEVGGEASSSAQALKLLREQTWNMVLLDISLPGKSGLDLLKIIKSEWPDLPVLILSMYPEDQYALRVIKGGADGYLTKESAPDELIGAIRRVAQGGKHLSRQMAEKLVSEVGHRGNKQPHELLSDREFQILCMIASGKTVTQIAEEMHLSVKTVSTYRTRIMQKTGLSNNVELTHYAIQSGLVT
jgi:two-component system, NarL family, invasion response regulator UvrY